MSWLKKIPPKGLDRTDEILSRHLDSDFIVFPMAEDIATRAMVADVEQQVGVRFPTEYVSHVCGQFPGVYVAAKEEVWPRPEPYDVGPFWTFLFAVHTFTPLKTGLDWMRLDVVAEQFQSETGLRAAPILKLKGDANLFCVDEAGSILGYDHELNTLSPSGIGFWDLFEREVTELVGRKNRLVEQGEKM